jgi:hypothetical protein
VSPDDVPFYIVLVGSPELIPFDFQYLLDVEYAVGRLDFDRTEDYETYARSVVEQETATTPLRSSTAVAFGTNHEWDPRATGLSATELVAPLASGHDGEPAAVTKHGLRAAGIVGAGATRAALLDVLAGANADVERPSLLFTASHGLGGLPVDAADRQRREHGALVCQDWAQPGPVDVDNQTVAGHHVGDANVHGLIAFFFACYGAGTPALDEFPGLGQERAAIAEQPFVAALPKSLLSHPNGAALAVVAHVERAFPTSISGRGGTQIEMYESALGQIAACRPVGLAMAGFNEKYASLSTSLASELREVAFGKQVPQWRIASLWLERHDAQNFVVLGDPAVRLQPR